MLLELLNSPNSFLKMTHFAYALANFITSKISNHFNGLDPTMMIALNTGGIHELISGIVTSYKMSSELAREMTFKMLVLVSIIFLLFRNGSRIYSVLSKLWKQPSITSSIEIEEEEVTRRVSNYVYSKNFPGIQYRLRQDRSFSISADLVVTFDDDGTHGTITTSEKRVEVLDNDKKSIKIVFNLILSIIPNDARAYYDHIDKWTVEEARKKPHYVLNILNRLTVIFGLIKLIMYEPRKII